MHGPGLRLALALVTCAVVLASARPVTAEPNVVVSIKPLHALVARVMAGTGGTPHLLVQGALSAHTYALKPSDATRLHEADLFFRMSDAMEPFTAKVVRSLPRRTSVVTLQETPALHLLERRTGAPFDDAAGDGNGHGDMHGHEHAGHEHGAVDGHAWLDPGNAKLMAGRIAEALAEKSPAQAAAFRANADGLGNELDALSAELARELAPIARKPYIVFHDALQYFERRYGLTPAGSIAVSPEVPPSARRLSALRRQIAERGAECVFAEAQFDARLVDAVVEGTPARVGTIDPEGSRLEPGPGLYVTLLRNLARDLKACLAPAG